MVAEGKVTITAKQAVCTLLAKHAAHPGVSARLKSLAEAYETKEPVQTATTLNQARGVLADREAASSNSMERSPALAPLPGPVNLVEQQRSFRQAEGLGFATLSPHSPKVRPKVSVEAIGSDLKAEPEAPERSHQAAPSPQEATGEAEYLRQDREFIEEEVRARRQIESELLNTFRHLMTAENPLFFQHLDEEGRHQLLSFRNPRAAKIVEQRLKEAANDDQVLRYIHRMMPTLPHASVDDELRSFPLVEPTAEVGDDTIEAFLEIARDRSAGR
jgi:hypothetical protein